MSKASEWQRQAADILTRRQQLLADEGRAPSYGVPASPGYTSLIAEVDSQGHLRLSKSERTLTPEQALGLAEWLRETFSEPSP